MRPNVLIRLATVLLCAGLAGAAETPSAPPQEVGGYLELGFENLASYKYDLPEWDGTGKVPKPKPGQIPASVKAWSGREAVVKGFVFPLDGDEKGFRTFVLVRHMASCCFGANVQPTDFVMVTMPQGKLLENLDTKPIRVFGRLEVGEEFEDGFLTSIYRMKAERLEKAS